MENFREEISQILKELGYTPYLFTAGRQDFVNHTKGIFVQVRDDGQFSFTAAIGLVLFQLGPCSPVTDRAHFLKMEHQFFTVFNKARS